MPKRTELRRRNNSFRRGLSQPGLKMSPPKVERQFVPSDNSSQIPNSDNSTQIPKSDNSFQIPKSDNSTQIPKSDNSSQAAVCPILKRRQFVSFVYCNPCIQFTKLRVNCLNFFLESFVLIFSRQMTTNSTKCIPTQALAKNILIKTKTELKFLTECSRMEKRY